MTENQIKPDSSDCPVSETSDYSSLGSDRPLVNSQDLSQLLSPEEDRMSPIESTPPIKSQPKTCSIRHDVKAVLTTNWKGSQVVNYKKFKKCCDNSQNACQQSQSTIPLRRVENDFYKKLSESQTDLVDQIKVKTEEIIASNEAIESDPDKPNDGIKRRISSEENGEEIVLKKARSSHLISDLI